MPRRIVLSVDIGTSSLKAALIDGEGTGRAFARIPYPPLPAAAVRPAADWEAALGRALTALAKAAPGQRPEAVCISGNGPTLIPVTAEGEALPPLHWHDHRFIPAEGSSQPSLFLPRAAWLREREPGLYAKTRRLFSSQEWLSWRLGAEPVTVLASESYRPYYWDGGGGGFFKVDREKFPPFAGLGEMIGRVSAGALEHLGGLGGWLAPGTPIAAGGPDFIAALSGTAVFAPGMAVDRAGTSEGLNLCIPAPPEGRPPGLRFLPGAAPGLWNAGALIPSSGRLFDWYRNRSGQTDRPYEAILGEIAGIPPALEAPYFFPDPSGEGGRYAGGDNPGRAELGRGLIEAMGFLSAEAMDRIEAAGRTADPGFRLGELRLSGGQCKSRTWNRLKADISGRTLLGMEIPDGELAGDAAAALFALGDFSSVKEAAGHIVRGRELYKPDPARAALYAERRAKFRELAGGAP